MLTFGLGIRAVVVGAAAAVTSLFITPAMAQADEIRDSQWMLDALDIATAHELTTGEGVTIGLVDSGVDATHPDLAGSIDPGKSYWDGGEDGLKDTTGHGTAMASLLVGHGHGEGGQDGVLGIAPGARVLPVSIYPPDWDPSVQNRDIYDDMVSGIRWLADNGADVILVALGNISTDESLEAAVTYATETKNVPVVAGVGNREQGHITVKYPAALPEAFGVSGTTKDGEFWEGSVDGRQVLLSAPADVTAAWKDHGYDDTPGTSNSSAIVAGTVALMESQWPDMEWEDIEWRLGKTATDKGKAGSDSKFGWGIVNPVAALTAHVGPPDGISDEQINPEPYERQTETDQPEDSQSTSSGDALAAKETGSNLFVWIGVAVAPVASLAIVVTVLVLHRKRSSLSLGRRHSGISPVPMQC